MKIKNLLISFLSLLFATIIPAGNPAWAGENTGTPGVTTVFCSPDLLPLATLWANEFGRLHPDQQIQVASAEGRTLSTLLKTSGQIGFISGKDASGLSSQPAWEVLVGREVIVPVVSSSNPFLEEINRTGISPEALKASLKSSSACTWATLAKNGQAQPIHFLIAQDPSTVGCLSEFLKVPPEIVTGMKEVSRNEMAAALIQDPLAVGFCRLTDILDEDGRELAANVRLLPIDKNGNGKLDYMEQIYSNVQTFSRGVWIGKYPKALAVDLFSVSSAQPVSETATEFLSWVLTEGQQFLNTDGYCSLVINERQTQLDKVNPPVIASVKAFKPVSYLKYFVYGMAALLVLGFLFDQSVRFYRRRQSAVRTERLMAPVCFDEHTIAAPRGFFFDKSHTWAFIEQDGTVRTGIDDFLRHVTGPVTRVEMKNPGDRIRKGDPFLTLIQEGKKLVIHSPVSGTIKVLNKDLITRASILHSSPYEAGWVYRIEPVNWAREITLMAMAEKYALWLNQEFARLKDFIATSLHNNYEQYSHVVLQDGGALKDNLLSEFGPEVWEDFQEQFLDAAR